MTTSSFRGKYSFLSNFYKVKIKDFPSVENAFQASKSLDPDTISKFKDCSPKQAKALGRRVDLRPDWDEVKLYAMYKALQIKFSDPVLRQKLLSTPPQKLLEINKFCDNYWGSCSCIKCRGKGKNYLGRILQKVQSECFTSSLKSSN